MPTYDYACENGHVNTETRSIHDDRIIQVCAVEGCGSTVLNQVYSQVATTFKGKGFYSTDSKTELLKPGQHVDW